MFGIKKRAKSKKMFKEYFKLINGYAPAFTSFDGGVYEMELTRAAIHAIATQFSKLKIEITGPARQDLKNTLLYKPNDFMDSSKFLYRVATILCATNTAFIVPIEDGFGKLIGYYPLLPTRCEVKEVQGQAYLRYQMANGKVCAIEFEKVGILTIHQYKNDFFGESNRVLDPTLQLINAQNQGIINAIKQSAAIRFIAKLNNFFDDEDIKEERERFSKTNLSADNDTGLLLFDNKYSDIKQIESKPIVTNPKQMEVIQTNVFNYFGVNQDILQNSFNEDKWNAFYEGKIEPLAIQLSLVLTNMTFSQHQIAFNNSIKLTANRLQYASNTSKLSIVTSLFDRGMLTTNQGLEIFNMAPVEGGDKYYIRKEYTNTDDFNKQKGGGEELEGES